MYLRWLLHRLRSRPDHHSIETTMTQYTAHIRSHHYVVSYSAKCWTGHGMTYSIRGILGPSLLITLPEKIPKTAKQEYRAALPLATKLVSEARDPPAPIPWIALSMPIHQPSLDNMSCKLAWTAEQDKPNKQSLSEWSPPEHHEFLVPHRVYYIVVSCDASTSSC